MEQLSLFTLPSSPAPLKTIHDPYWDEITCDKVDEILPTNCNDLDSSTVSPGQFLQKEFAPQHNTPFSDTKDTQQPKFPCEFVGAQVNSDTQKVAPQHDTHWVECYWVDRGGNKYWYYRYCWMTGRKKSRVYIGSTTSAIALKKKQAVEIAIADGETPSEIRKMIKEWGNSQRTSETSAVHPKS